MTNWLLSGSSYFKGKNHSKDVEQKRRYIPKLQDCIQKRTCLEIATIFDGIVYV